MKFKIRRHAIESDTVVICLTQNRNGMVYISKNGIDLTFNCIQYEDGKIVGVDCV